MEDALKEISLMLDPERCLTASREAGERGVMMCMNTSKFLPKRLGSLIAALFWSVLRPQIETAESDLANPQLL